MLTPTQNNLDRYRPPRGQIRGPKPTIRELTNSAGRLVVNLQRVVIQPLKAHMVATDRTEDRLIQTQWDTLIIEIDILVNSSPAPAVMDSIKTATNFWLGEV
jgi:hypothetical protein